MAEKNPFEITPELRALTLESVEQARTAYCRFMDFLTQILNASSTVMNPLFCGARIVQERAIEFAREKAERLFTLEREFAHANDVQEMPMLQSGYVHAQMKSCAGQAQELGRLMARNIPAFGRTVAALTRRPWKGGGGAAASAIRCLPRLPKPRQ